MPPAPRVNLAGALFLRTNVHARKALCSTDTPSAGRAPRTILRYDNRNQPNTLAKLVDKPVRPTFPARSTKVFVRALLSSVHRETTRSKLSLTPTSTQMDAQSGPIPFANY